MGFDAQWLITLGIMQGCAFFGYDGWLTMFRGSNSPKILTNRQKIGHFMRDVDSNEEWRHRRMTSMTPRRLRCCKSIVQGQITGHSFTACMLVIQSQTKFSRNQGNFIVNVKSQFIWMYWKMMWLHLTNDITITSEKMKTLRVLLLHHKLNKTPTAVKLLHIVNILILCTSTEHVFNVSAVLSHYELHTTTHSLTLW